MPRATATGHLPRLANFDGARLPTLGKQVGRTRCAANGPEARACSLSCSCLPERCPRRVPHGRDADAHVAGIWESKNWKTTANLWAESTICAGQPWKCRLRLHEWDDWENPETYEHYEVCRRCNAYRDTRASFMKPRFRRHRARENIGTALTLTKAATHDKDRDPAHRERSRTLCRLRRVRGPGRKLRSARC
jgi:hypothetical protein